MLREFFLVVCLFWNMFSSPNFKFKNTHEVLVFVKSLLPESPVILEAGGNQGEDTIKMKALWPEAIMHVFEPLPSSFEKIIKTTRGLSNVHCYNYALTNYLGVTNFYIDIPNNAASSIGYPVAWNEHEFDKNPIQVPCITLDEWAEVYNINNIDFMWLDMESHELYALEKGINLLNSVKAIYTEIAFVPLRQGGCLYPDIKKFLEKCNFYEVWKSCSSGRFGDALFIKKDILK